MRSETDMVAAAGTARGGAGPDAGVAARRRGGSAACARRGVNPIRVARTRVSRSGERQGRALRRCLRRGRRRRGGAAPASRTQYRGARRTLRRAMARAGRMAAAFGRAGAGWRAACAPDLGPGRRRCGGGGCGQRLHGAGDQRRAGARGAGPWLPAGPAPARVQDRAMRAEPFSRRRSCSRPRATSAWIWSCAAASPTISVASCSTPRRPCSHELVARRAA